MSVVHVHLNYQAGFLFIFQNENYFFSLKLSRQNFLGLKIWADNVIVFDLKTEAENYFQSPLKTIYITDISLKWNDIIALVNIIGKYIDPIML